MLYHLLRKVWRYEECIQNSGGKLTSKYPPGRRTGIGLICDGDRLMELVQYHIEWQALVL
jgi:hypothetical protein